MLHFLKVHVSVVHQQRITFLKFMIAGLCIPKVFLSWDTFKARRESPSAEPQLPLTQIFLLSSCFPLLHKADALADGRMN